MKHYFPFIILLFLFSCKKENNYSAKDVIQDDSLNFYYDRIKREDLTEKQYIKYSNKILNYYKLSSNKNRELSPLYLASDIFYKYSKNEELLDSSQLLLEKALKQNDTINIAHGYTFKGKYFFDNSINDSSFYYLVNAEKIYSRLNDTLNLANVYMLKSKIYIDENDFVSGLNVSFLALKYLKNSDRYKDLLNTYNSIGSASEQIQEYDNSIFYYKKAINLINDKFDKNQNYLSTFNNNIGFIYQKQNKNSQAIDYFLLALRNKKLKSDYPYLYSIIIDNLAYSKLRNKDFSNLPDLFNEALKIRTENDLTSGIIYNKIHLSEYYAMIGDTLSSKIFSLEALKKAREVRIARDILLALKQSSLIDKKNATVYTEEYIKINDSLQILERKNIDRFARIELETDELRQQNTQLSEQNRDILNYFAIAIVFGGFLFFARFQRLKARELALKQTQQQANEEIYRLIISHQNQLEEGRDLEKKRISKELHDGVLGRLFGLRLNLDGLNNFDDEETKQQRLDYLNELKVIEQDLREISHELSRENLVLINNFVAIINNLLEQQSKINKAKINTLISDKIDWEKVSNTIKINLYRILQESLQNINKHAEANKINVIFNKDPKGNLIFSVEDDGKGYNTNGKKTKGIGMNNIVDRVHQCQGKIDIKSQIGKGTKIIITFPLENETINM